ncbi:hypothetical protein IFG57_003973 [Salmonella enterica]|nr:hypothetical protein [Salmonella enterica]
MYNLSRKAFEDLKWFLYDIQFNIFEMEEGKIELGGNVFFRLESDRNNEECDENLELLWLQFSGEMTDVDNIKINPLEEGFIGSNLIGFKASDQHLYDALLIKVFDGFPWQQEVMKNIRKSLI